MKKILVIIACILIATIACSDDNTITGQQRDEIMAYADPAAENLLAGFNEEDHAKFSRDFSEQMKNAMTEPVFKQTREGIVSKIGLYKSRNLFKVEKKGPHIVVLYKAEFEKESGVEVKVVFTKYGEKDLVSGLWFNSPKLRE